MRPPIILDDEGTAAIFRDLSEMLRYVEPIDLEEGAFACDSDGRRIKLTTRRVEKVSLFGLLRDIDYTPIETEVEDDPTHADELTVLLQHSVQAVDPLARVDNYELSELVRLAVEKLGYTR